MTTYRIIAMSPDWLNYHHLLYFWTVAREGTVAAAAERLGLAQPTVSAQVRVLEKSMGHKLFRRVGRRLVLTDDGQFVYRYADEIFHLGRELIDTLHGRPTGRDLQFNVGVADVLPKLVAYRLLAPALAMAEPLRMICHEGKPEELVAQLALHKLDLVLSDAPVGGHVRVKAFNHRLGECGVTIFGKGALLTKYRRGFPESLDGAPLLAPAEPAMLRRTLEQWFEVSGIRPRIVAEFADTALLKTFGEAGVGLCATASVIEEQVHRQYGLRVVGRLEGVREQFYAISVERRVKHPAVLAIATAARDEIFNE